MNVIDTYVVEQADAGVFLSAELPPSLGLAARADYTTVYRFRRRLADAEFDRELNHQHICEVLQAHSMIAAKRGGAE